MSEENCANDCSSRTILRTGTLSKGLHVYNVNQNYQSNLCYTSEWSYLVKHIHSCAVFGGRHGGWQRPHRGDFFNFFIEIHIAMLQGVSWIVSMKSIAISGAIHVDIIQLDTMLRAAVDSVGKSRLSLDCLGCWAESMNKTKKTREAYGHKRKCLNFRAKLNIIKSPILTIIRVFNISYQTLRCLVSTNRIMRYRLMWDIAESYNVEFLMPT